MSDMLNVIRAAANEPPASPTGSFNGTVDASQTPDAAYKSAYARGFAEGNDRAAAVLGADGINGDAARMQAALSLMSKSPNMAASAVVSFVTTNVGAGSKMSYAQRRIGAGLEAQSRLNSGGNAIVAEVVDGANKRKN